MSLGELSIGQLIETDEMLVHINKQMCIASMEREDAPDPDDINPDRLEIARELGDRVPANDREFHMLTAWVCGQLYDYLDNDNKNDEALFIVVATVHAEALERLRSAS